MTEGKLTQGPVPPDPQCSESKASQRPPPVGGSGKRAPRENTVLRSSSTRRAQEAERTNSTHPAPGASLWH